eukprot:CAMPEP_0179437518 /NCGR_PEP_ID=MMETSP0799-20121207/21399_1 /TAXON_ID=46947 /ORGANISM="Geminigera cryophila, Strain CCMP2564" /LENGTH=558 /DNA_ID=CAMNT_0021218511 /DNA_START=135 /DNA_END=1811 /DNA_ORIENTATION=-
MSSSVVESQFTSVQLAKGGVAIACDVGVLTAGDQGLTLQRGSTGSQYVIEAIATAGIGSWGIIGGTCDMERSISDSNKFTVPPSGQVKLRIAHSGQNKMVTTSKFCTYEVCAACTAAKYRSSSDCACANCPADSNSLAGSTAVSDCTCNKGFTGPNGGPCTVCGTGTYKSDLGDAPCTSCPTHSTSPQTSTTKTDQTACICNDGYGGANGETCTECSAGTYKSGTQCSNCPVNSNSPKLSTSVNDCECNAGSYGPNGGSCTACPTAKPFSEKGSTSSDACIATCSAGFTGSVPCTACPAGKYKQGAGDGACLPCPSGKVSESQSGALTDCECAVGTTGLNGVGATCVKCVAGKYKAATGEAACRSCADMASSAVGSDKQEDCKCNAGYSGPDGGACSPTVTATATGTSATATLVEMKISLPITKAEFTESKQEAFRSAVAATAIVAVADVTILNIEEMARRAASVHITTQVKASDSTAGNNIVANWDLAALNKNLATKGLKAAVMVTMPAVQGKETTAKPQSTAVPSTAMVTSSSCSLRGVTLISIVLSGVVSLVLLL